MEARLAARWGDMCIDKNMLLWKSTASPTARENKSGIAHKQDPLSPYLFLAIAELLWCLLVEGAGDDWLLHPLVDDLTYPIIQYADDALIVICADPGQLRHLSQPILAVDPPHRDTIQKHRCAPGRQYIWYPTAENSPESACFQNCIQRFPINQVKGLPEIYVEN
jgi:hypothetical protein